MVYYYGQEIIEKYGIGTMHKLGTCLANCGTEDGKKAIWQLITRIGNLLFA